LLQGRKRGRGKTGLPFPDMKKEIFFRSMAWGVADILL